MLRAGTHWVAASITSVRHVIDIETQAHIAARQLSTNDIGLCHLTTLRPIAVQDYATSKTTGAFVLVDRETAQTVAAGLMVHPLRRGRNLGWAQSKVTPEQRAANLAQTPLVVWFTGLSGSGKSTLATLVEAQLAEQGHAAFVLDGDNLRHGLNEDLGFTDADRVENIRRAGSVAALFADAGLIVLCSFISPFRADRVRARQTIGAERFLEVFVDAPIETCIERDPKGLYKRSLSGELPRFTGIDAPYEPPATPDLHLKTAQMPLKVCVELVCAMIKEHGENYNAKSD
jgi:bifunctional enzyme CysN/CysC